MRFQAVTVMMLSVCLAAAAQYQQYQDHTARKSSATAAAERLDVNHASLDQLLKLPGMTRVWADRIVRFRPYRTKQDLVGKGILTPEIYSRIKDYVIAHREK